MGDIKTGSKDQAVNNKTLAGIAEVVTKYRHDIEETRVGGQDYVKTGYVSTLLDRVEAIAKRAYNEIDRAVCSMGCVNVDNVRMVMDRTLGDYHE